MLVNNETGRMRINARVFSNERYRAMVALDKSDPLKIGTWGLRESLDNFVTFKQETTEYRMRNYAFSPPGVVLSMGDVDITSRVGFVNNVSHFEVFGNAAFSQYTPRVNDFGLDLTGVDADPHIYTTVGYCLWPNSKGVIVNTCSFGPIYPIKDPDRLISLFYVHGDTKGAQTAFESTTRHALLEQVSKVLLDRFSRDGLNVGQHKPRIGYAVWTPRLAAKVRMDDRDPNILYLDSWFETVVDVGFGRNITKEKGSDRTKKFTLMKELEKVVEALSTVIAELMDEFMGWWD